MLWNRILKIVSFCTLKRKGSKQDIYISSIRYDGQLTSTQEKILTLNSKHESQMQQMDIK